MNPTSENPGPSHTRGTLPDAETPDRIYLLKNVTRLRATYQVRLLALKAAATGKELVLQVPRTCRFEASLDELVRFAAPFIRREDLP